MKTDIQIAQEAVLEPISDVAASLGLDGESLIPYGKYKAKVDHRLVKKLAEKKDAKVILVTAISPTPAGEGKTTTSVGLADALHMELGLAMSLGMLLGAALGQLAPKGGKESTKEDDHETH